MPTTDHWKVLGLRPTRDTTAIHAAWKRLAGQHHPDRGGDAEKFKEAKLAYDYALENCSKIIEVKRPPKLYRIRTKITCVQALNERTMTVQWSDDTGSKQEAEVHFPIWNVEWGHSHSLVVRNLMTSNGTVDLQIDIHLENNTKFVFENGKLIWKPELGLLDVLGGREIMNPFDKSRHIAVDCNGKSVLHSYGFLNKEGVRTDILVEPNYVWPEKYE